MLNLFANDRFVVLGFICQDMSLARVKIEEAKQELVNNYTF